VDEQRIQTIVERVLQKLQSEIPSSGQSSPKSGAPFIAAGLKTGSRGTFEDINMAVSAAMDAHHILVEKTSLETRAKMIQALRDVTIQNLKYLSHKTVEETGLGRPEDKINKNRLAAEKTPGIEILLPKAYSGDFGLALVERAPYGVIASITPCTNATETLLNNVIGMLAGGNSVVINPHPLARKISVEYVRMMNDAIISAGGPDNTVCTIVEPTIEGAQQLMKHRDTSLVVVTGGPQVVKVAMSLGKKVIAAGPGNPPAIVDETAHIDRAAKNIIAGASLDNNIVCIVEKEIIAVESIADHLKKELIRNGAYYLKEGQVARLEKIIVDGDHPARPYIGKNAGFILKEIGVEAGDDVRIAFCDVNEAHPFVQIEQLMPVIPMVRVRNVDEAIQVALRVEHGFRHTATMHSTNIENLHRMARACNTSIFVKNAPSFAGLGMTGEGYTSWTIASPTGEGLTTALNYTRERRCTLKDYFRIV
jgi:acyl-CoA reductase-like NAD-dependent aldehyde dehydrogenase